MGFKGTTVNKLNGGLGQTNPTADGDMIFAGVIPVADLPVGVVHYTAYELLQPEDAEDLGIDAAFDANEGLLIHNDISEFFRLTRPGAKLFFIPVPALLTATQIMTAAAFQTAVRGTTGKCIGISGTATEAVDIDTIVEAVQAQVAVLATNKKLISLVILEGVGEAATTTAISAYPDQRAKTAPNVQVCIAQDGGVADLDAAYAKRASIGSVLGMYSVRQVNENLGSVDILNKPDAKKANQTYPLNEADKWTEARLSDGTLVSTLSQADMDSLTAKGYIFAGSYQDYPGVYFNNSPTCVELASDYSFGENNRTWDKAADGIRLAMMPKVKGIIKKDPTTGYIKSTSVTALKNLAEKPLKKMLADNEISGFEVYINPQQITGVSNPLQVKAIVVKDDIAHEITVDLGLSTQA